MSGDGPGDRDQRGTVIGRAGCWAGERARKLAAESHAVAVESKLETRRARKLADWSPAVAVLALIAVVVVPLIVG